MTAGGSVDIQSLILAEIVAVFLAPLLVFGNKGFLRAAAHALTVPKRGHKVHPLLAAIGAWFVPLNTAGTAYSSSSASTGYLLPGRTSVR